MLRTMGKREQPFMPHDPFRHQVQSRSKQPLRNTPVPQIRANRQGAKKRNAPPTGSDGGADEFVFQVSRESCRGICYPASPHIVCIAEEFYWIRKPQKSPKRDPENAVRFSEICLYKLLDEHVHFGGSIATCELFDHHDGRGRPSHIVARQQCYLSILFLASFRATSGVAPPFVAI